MLGKKHSVVSVVINTLAMLASVRLSVFETTGSDGPASLLVLQGCPMVGEEKRIFEKEKTKRF